MSIPGFSATDALAHAEPRRTLPARQPGVMPGGFLTPQRVSGRFSRLGYTCDSRTNKCSCEGILDCDDMRKDICNGNWECTPTKCTCKWRQVVAR